MQTNNNKTTSNQTKLTDEREKSIFFFSLDKLECNTFRHIQVRKKQIQQQQKQEKQQET